jgi:hypothetical protein
MPTNPKESDRYGNWIEPGASPEERSRQAVGFDRPHFLPQRLVGNSDSEQAERGHNTEIKGCFAAREIEKLGVGRLDFAEYRLRTAHFRKHKEKNDSRRHAQQQRVDGTHDR